MDAEARDGVSMRFWLTLRLTRELVRTLTGYLTASSPEKIAVRPDNVAAVQRFLHQEAKDVARPLAPVVLHTTSSAQVLERVVLRSGGGQIAIAIPLSDGDEATLSFKPQEIRQWLNILYQQCVVAEWPLDMWPEWVRTPSGGESGSAQSIVH